MPTNALFHASVADSLMQPLFVGSAGGAVWQDTNVDSSRLPPMTDALCPELSSVGLADGLEPGEVVFEGGGGVAQVGPATKPSSSASAHNLYNSYAYNPWARFRGSAGAVVAPLTAAAGLCERDGVLRAELRHLRAALNEKTREVGELTRDLQSAYGTIDRLRQIQSSAPAADASGVDPTSLAEGLDAAENPVPPTFAEKVDGLVAPAAGHTIGLPVDIELTVSDLCSELEQAGNDVAAKSAMIDTASNVASASPV